MEENKAANVCIIGGSYAGIYVAKSLESKGIRVTIIERNETFYHKIGAARAAVVPGYEEVATFSYEGCLKLPGSIVIWGEVSNIDVTNRVVAYLDRSADTRELKELSFSALVGATGLSHIIPGQLPDRSLSEEEIHQHLRNLQSEIAKAASPLVVVGGGPVGCEFAGEVKCEHPEKRVVLIHSRKRLVSARLSGLSDKFAEVLKSKLSNVGVEVFLNTGRKYSLEDFGVTGGEVHRATGLKQTESGYKLYPASWLSDGEIVVNDRLQVKTLAEKGVHYVYACGDVVYTEVDYKKAGIAYMHAKVIAENIATAMNGGNPADFSAYKSPELKLARWKKRLAYVFGLVRSYVAEDGALGMAVGRNDGLMQYANILWSDRTYRLVMAKDKGAGRMKAYTKK